MGSEDDFAEAEALLEALETGQPITKKAPLNNNEISYNTTYDELTLGDLIKFDSTTYCELCSSPLINYFGITALDLGHRFLKGFVVDKENNGNVVRIRVYGNPNNTIKSPYFLEYRVAANKVELLDINLEENIISQEDRTAAELSPSLIIEEEKKKALARELKEKEEKAKKDAENKKKELEKVQGRIDEITSIAEEIHPDRWSFDIIKSNEFTINSTAKFRLTIHFPELTITNSNKRSHKISDLYICMFFNSNMEHIGGLYGNRGTISYPELCFNYRHSHLRPTSDSNWNSFCLGDGTTTSQIVNGLAADRWNPTLFRSCLLILYGYSEWESLEGGPYIRIAAVNNNSRTATMDVDDSTKIKYYRNFIKTYENFPVTLSTENNINKFKVNITEEFEQFVTRLILTDDLLVIKQLNGEYTPRENNISDVISRINNFNTNAKRNLSNGIVFKNQIIYTQCINSNLNMENITSLVANPNITRYIAEQLEKEINEYQLKIESYELG